MLCFLCFHKFSEVHQTWCMHFSSFCVFLPPVSSRCSMFQLLRHATENARGNLLWVTSLWHRPKYIADIISQYICILLLSDFISQHLLFFTRGVAYFLAALYAMQILVIFVSFLVVSSVKGLGSALYTTSRTVLWTSSVIWLLTGTLDMASFIFQNIWKHWKIPGDL